MTPPRESVQSAFVAFPLEFERWFYHFVDIERQGGYVGSFDDLGIGRALRALGVSDRKREEGGRNVIFSAQHWDPEMRYGNGKPVPMNEQTYLVDGREYPVREICCAFESAAFLSVV